MNKLFRNHISVLILLLFTSTYVLCGQVGQIAGTLILDDTWDRHIYVSHIESFEKEYIVSNDIIVTSADIDSLGDFNIELSNIPVDWSLLRLHIVKKGISPNSLVIGSKDENYFFLIAKRDSNIKLFNTPGTPIFKNTIVEGLPFINTFDKIKKLSIYPNSIDYENSLIEKEFIIDVINEKLKAIADTCQHHLVSLYAIYQTDFYADYKKNPLYYNTLLSRWQNENSTYFESFRLKFPNLQNANSNYDSVPIYVLLISLSLVLMIGFYFKRKRKWKIETLSVQERKIFGFVQKGMSNKEICAECNIELTTVKSHVGNIYSKLNIKSRKEAINLKV
jgi:DNA-binding CsgD family transcriptional regulator